MYAPGVLWTAAHRIPLLSVMLNNRGYHQEIMHVQRMCNQRNRESIKPQDRACASEYRLLKGCARAGLHGEGPITDPKDSAAPSRSCSVKRGEPALVDVVTQPR
jgi:benzoylformate decarboxylase/acetolactate synthase-1/2/3 large subunit